jgi:hypothetical protein
VGAFGEVQVVDWGLAKILQQGKPSSNADEGDVADVSCGCRGSTCFLLQIRTDSEAVGIELSYEID